MSKHPEFVIFALAAWLPILLFLIRALLQLREEKDKYKLTALRDDLLYLVASGHIDDDNELYKIFSSAIATSIDEIRNLTLSGFINASIQAKDSLERQRFDQLATEYESASPDVQKFVMRFFSIMMEIMTANSPELRFTLFAKNKLGRFAQKFKRALGAKLSKTYATYQYFAAMRSRLLPH